MAEYEKALEEGLREDKEYLKHCLEGIWTPLTTKTRSFVVVTPVHNWWKSDETCVTVARILERWGQFKERSDVIDFFEKPYKFEDNMKFIVEEM